MTDTTFIPDYLKPALERLAEARAAHLCLLYTSPSPRDVCRSRMPSSA